MSDHYFPGTAPFLVRKLGMTRVPALDIRQQCAGFVYGLQLADALVRSGQHRNILLVGGDDRVINNIQRYGNTTAGTLPILLHEARQQGKVAPGSLLAFVALGAGLNWGAVLYRS